mmetsp:Transcript_7565/g.11319  ORF Transcript_7565/g.11319 Transcript_7565/m.11319 type:complete len:230 (+) Transcript_7565:15-704(+)
MQRKLRYIIETLFVFPLLSLSNPILNFRGNESDFKGVAMSNEIWTPPSDPSEHLKMIDALKDTVCIDKRYPILLGVDVVSYYFISEGEAPLQGDIRVSTLYNNFTFLFATNSNKLLFDSDPERFVPPFGNFCAYGMAYEQMTFSDPNVGLGSPVDPSIWKIGSDGRLYLFRDNEALNKFFVNEVASVYRADNFWKQATNDCKDCFNTYCLCILRFYCRCPPVGEKCYPA